MKKTSVLLIALSIIIIAVGMIWLYTGKNETNDNKSLEKEVKNIQNVLKSSRFIDVYENNGYKLIVRNLSNTVAITMNAPNKIKTVKFKFADDYIYTNLNNEDLFTISVVTFVISTLADEKNTTDLFSNDFYAYLKVRDYNVKYDGSIVKIYYKDLNK